MSITHDEETSQENRTWLCAVVFLDVVGYTKGSVEEQIRIKDHMNSVIQKSIEGIAEIDRVIVDSGDGAALCFLGDPEHSLFCAIKLRDGFDVLSNQSDIKYEVRIGINLGPVRVIKDVNMSRNVLGDGINVAERIMSFSSSGKIFVSRSFFEVISCLSQEYESLFDYLGIKKDKHEREHTVYEFDIDRHTTSNIDENTPGLNSGGIDLQTTVSESEPSKVNRARLQPQATTPKPAHEWEPATLQTAEDELAQHIGPVAKILVKKFSKTTNDVRELYEQLGETLVDLDHRANFLRQMPAAPVTADSEVLDAKTPVSSPPDSNITREWDDQKLKIIERHLAEHLGPLSGMLVKKAAGKATSIKELYDLLATSLDDESARRAFMKTRQ